jgi:hypothetical protein
MKITTNSFIRAQRATFVEELKDHTTANLIVGMLYTEDAANPLPVLESLFNRTLFVRSHDPKRTLAQMITGGFYGPYNRGKYPDALAHVARSPILQAKFNDAIDAALAGSNVIHGYTDQGLPTDPNGWRTPRMWINGEVFNDWAGGPGGHAGAMAWRERFLAAASST